MTGSKQQRYQKADEARERYETSYARLEARLRLQDLLRNSERYEIGLERRERWQYQRLVGPANLGADITKPVTLPMKIQRSLTRRQGLVSK